MNCNFVFTTSCMRCPKYRGPDTRETNVALRLGLISQAPRWQHIRRTTKSRPIYYSQLIGLKTFINECKLFFKSLISTVAAILLYWIFISLHRFINTSFLVKVYIVKFLLCSYCYFVFVSTSALLTAEVSKREWANSRNLNLGSNGTTLAEHDCVCVLRSLFVTHRVCFKTFRHFLPSPKYDCLFIPGSKLWNHYKFISEW